MSSFNLGIGALNSGLLIKRKFRWLLQLYKERQPLGEAQYVKMGHRPELQPSHSAFSVEDGKIVDIPPCLDHRQQFVFTVIGNKTWTEAILNEFDEAIVTLIDGVGNPVERWRFGDVTGHTLREEDDGEETQQEVTTEATVWEYEYERQASRIQACP